MGLNNLANFDKQITLLYEIYTYRLGLICFLTNYRLQEG